MNNKQKVEMIEAWQNNIFYHPLTCGNDSTHRPLQPLIIGDDVVLTCLDCDYKQKYIPDIVLNTENENGGKNDASNDGKPM